MTADFDRAITRQEELIVEVRKLQTSNRRRNAVIGFIILILGGISVLTVIALQAIHNANEANKHIAQVVVDAERQRADQALEACRLRNNTPRALREVLNADIDATVELLISAGTDETDIHNYAAARRAIIPSVGDTDRDCNGDNRISASDYPPD